MLVDPSTRCLLVRWVQVRWVRRTLISRLTSLFDIITRGEVSYDVRCTRGLLHTGYNAGHRGCHQNAALYLVKNRKSITSQHGKTDKGRLDRLEWNHFLRLK
jgi:hypothetical protein